MKSLRHLGPGNVRDIEISNVKMRCIGSCSSRILEFDVKNVSDAPVGEVSYGWMLPPPDMKECPANLATNASLNRVVQPGETVRDTIMLNVPEGAAARYCLRVTAVRAPQPWQR
jgi:hypothetical protein